MSLYLNSFNYFKVKEIIFSSKDIPGNEKSINNLQNLLIRQKVEIITSDDELFN